MIKTKEKDPVYILKRRCLILKVLKTIRKNTSVKDKIKENG